ncbi:MAG: TraM recognition domain-containing protein, partial [Candidatus Paceibacterota bacterium]
AERERSYAEAGKDTDEAANDVVREYRAESADGVVIRQFQESDEGAEKIALDLAPEEHDTQMAEFIEMVHEKGVKNTLAIIEKMNNPHLEDDFHRFLVEYLREGYSINGLKPKSPLARSLRHTLYEVVLPREYNEEDNQKPLQDLLSSMEQFFAGMRSATRSETGQSSFTIELALPDSADEYSFYVSVPSEKAELFHKQILSVYSDAQVREAPDDYNIFNYEGATAGSVAVFEHNPAYPIKTYESFDHDPMNVILNSFTNVDRDGEGAAVQIVISTEGVANIKSKYDEAISAIKKGVSVNDATKNAMLNVVGEMTRDVASGFFEFFSSSTKKKDDEKQDEPKEVDQNAIEQIETKIASPLMRTNIRLIASSRTQHEAETILSDMESAFNQFENTNGNTFGFRRMKRGKMQKLINNFAFRKFEDASSLPLNTTELTSIIHFETLGLKGPSQLKETKGVSVPAPAGLSKEGILLGVNKHRNQEQEIKMSADDRLRHFYVIGQTGTGKTTLLKNMMVQDIQNGEGLCFIDPHGADVQDVLSAVPKERMQDVIYFDPSYTERPMGLNMLEYDPAHPEQKTFVVNELFKIFQKLYSSVPESMGPMFEQYFRNAAMLVVEHPDSGNTMLDISRVLTDDAFRKQKIANSNNSVVNQFWEEVAGKAGGEASLQNIVPYITSKFDVFMSNDIMRPIISQEYSSFNFREVMDSRKILLVNLAKGTLGDLNANLLGLIIVGKILMATLSRVDRYGKGEIDPFYLYIDEFQNVTTDSISTILSEARKYKLSLNVAHQYIAQLDEGIKDSIFGNVGSMCSFRIGSDDAEFLEHQFQPTVHSQDLMNVQNRNAYIRMLVGGEPVKPFSIATQAPTEGDYEHAERMKQLSYLTYGEDRTVVEEMIQKRYRK